MDTDSFFNRSPETGSIIIYKIQDYSRKFSEGDPTELGKIKKEILTDLSLVVFWCKKLKGYEY